MAYNHHIYKPKICGLELFIRMQYFMAYNHFIYKPKPTCTSLELLLIPRNRGKSGRRRVRKKKDLGNDWWHGEARNKREIWPFPHDKSMALGKSN